MLAWAATRPEGLVGVVNLSGGAGALMPGRNCDENGLMSAFASSGARSRVPTLWLYAENDTFFGPDLSRQMAEAFRAAGGRAEYHLLPSFADEGHFFVHSPEAVRLWAPVLDKCMAGIR